MTVKKQAVDESVDDLCPAMAWIGTACGQNFAESAPQLYGREGKLRNDTDDGLWRTTEIFGG
jgi:hypothetical protein